MSHSYIKAARIIALCAFISGVIVAAILVVVVRANIFDCPLTLVPLIVLFVLFFGIGITISLFVFPSMNR